jgi:uncharacterized protein YcbX
MENNPAVGRITIYPVKSLDGISLQEARIGNGGCLEHDREYAILDSHGNFVIGKTNALVHSLRSKIDFDKELISFRHKSTTNWQHFHLQDEKQEIDQYLSDFFRIKVSLLKNSEGRFMDIPDIAGLTVLSAASLETVATWFNDMDMEETRKRFRATIEIINVPPFWEDKLFFEEGTAIEFMIGDATILGISPRARCVVPTRHPETADVIHGFPKTFAKHRTANLPDWSTLENYGHFYYLTVNCLMPPSEIGKWITVGDEIKIIGNKIFT